MSAERAKRIPAPRRRILLVMNDFGWAGAEKQLYHLATGLSEAGHEVTLLAVGGSETDTAPLARRGIGIVSLGARDRPGKLLRLPALVRHARRAEIVHCTGWDATLWGRLAALLARRPTVFTEHTPGRGFQVNGRGAPRESWIAAHNRHLSRSTYAAVVVGAWQRGILTAEGVPAEKIVHIPNAVPVDELRREADRGPGRAELGIPDGARVLIHVARFTSQKGQPVTLRVAARLREELGEDLRVLFVGDGPEEAAVRREAREIGADWASFLGRRDDVPGLLRLADLCLLPSSGEGLPMALIEAGGIGTPVVATDVGDVCWLLETTGGGICVAVGDESGFAEACRSVLADAGLLARLSASAVEGVRGNFDAGTMTLRYEEVFEAAISAAPLPVLLSR